MPARPESLELGERYHDQVARLAQTAGQLLVRRIETLDVQDLQGSFARFIPEGVAILGVGQESTAALARAYLGILTRLETGQAVDLEEPLKGNAGFTADGRVLTEGLAATPAKVFLALKMGRTIEEALHFARFSVARFAQTEVADGARLEMSHQLQEADQVRGWRWRSRGTCPACLAMDDGAIRPADQPMKPHPFCQCIQEPALDVRETVQRETGPERFEQLPPADQVQLLGEERLELLQAGKVGWRDLFTVQSHREWRDVVTTRPVEDLEAVAAGK